METELQTDLAVRRHGRPANEAPTLLFLHGLTDSGSGWPGAVAHWQDRFHIVTVDQRGHGDSPRFTAEQLHGHPGDVLADDAEALLAQFPVAPVVLGHSLGGAVAITVAVRRPDLVRALVLEDPAALEAEEQQRNADRGRELADWVSESTAATDDRELVEVRRRAHPEWPEEELLPTGRAEQQTDRDFLAVGEYKPSVRWPELLAGLAVPTLVVTGDRDDVVVDQRLADLLLGAENPNLNVTRIEGAGHCVRRDQPERFFAVVDEFLSHH